MNFIDPTYLRTVHVGLKLGAVHKDNVSALPIGLVGMYEDDLPPLVNANERKKFLDFFLVWASLKTEVSSGFVVSLLEGWTEDQVTYYIAQNSKWFNSPVSGKYILYHERLRTFVLQKVSQSRIEKCNEIIIRQSHLALQFRAGDEWERYALEYLSAHLLISAMGNKDGVALKTLAYDTAHWSRQVEISRNFEWSKRMLNDTMLWASKYGDEEVIECALNKVDLYHLEQNDAPRIVELVRLNDIDTALQCIESVGGNGKEGLQRKFILYMLCLMELTLLESKEKHFKEEALDKLLKHLDDNLPVDHSVLNWNDFFPGYLVFLMACELSSMDFDYLPILNRTEMFNTEWIRYHGAKSILQVNVLVECINCIKHKYERKMAMINFSAELVKLGNSSQALSYARNISNECEKLTAFRAIYCQLTAQIQIEESVLVMREYVELAYGISDGLTKINSLTQISSELIKQGNIKEADSAMKEVFACAWSMENKYERNTALQVISITLARQRSFEEALECAGGITDEFSRRATFASISTEMWIQGENEKATNVMQFALEFDNTEMDTDSKSNLLETCSYHLIKQEKIVEAIECSRGISNSEFLNSALKDISNALAKQGRMEQALEYAMGITDVNYYWPSLGNIAKQLAKQGNLSKALLSVQDIQNKFRRNITLKDISEELTKQGKIEEAIDCAVNITDGNCYLSSLSNIAAELARQDSLKEASLIFQNGLSHHSIIISDTNKSKSLQDIAMSLVKANQLHLALKCIESLSDSFEKSNTLAAICEVLSNQFRIIEALSCVRIITDDNSQFIALKYIAFELIRFSRKNEVPDLANALVDYVREIMDERIKCILLAISSSVYEKLGMLEKSESILQESLICLKNMNDFLRINTLPDIASELVKQGKLEDALIIAEDLNLEVWKSRVLSAIAIQLGHQSQLTQALFFARGIIDHWWRGFSLKAIACELAQCGMFKEASFTMIESHGCFISIEDGENKSRALHDLSVELAKLGNLEEAFECTQSISIETDRINAWKAIATNLAEKGKWEEVEKVISQIVTTAERHKCLLQIGHFLLTTFGYEVALVQLNLFNHSESRQYLHQGITLALSVNNITPTLARQSLLKSMNELPMQEHILNQTALYQLYFTQISPKWLQRYKSTLSINWAIDIKASFSAN